MDSYLDHHNLAILSCCTSALELLSTQPETDTICELRDLLESQYDIIHCIISDRHYGSDDLDDIIHQCNNIMTQVKEFEGK